VHSIAGLRLFAAEGKAGAQPCRGHDGNVVLASKPGLFLCVCVHVRECNVCSTLLTQGRSNTDKNAIYASLCMFECAMPLGL